MLGWGRPLRTPDTSVRIDPSLRVHMIDCRFRDFSRGSSLHGSDCLLRGVSIAWGVPIPRGVSVLGSVPWVTWGWSDIVPNGGTGVDPRYGSLSTFRNVRNVSYLVYSVRKTVNFSAAASPTW